MYCVVVKKLLTSTRYFEGKRSCVYGIFVNEFTKLIVLIKVESQSLRVSKVSQ